ncbi:MULTISPECIES: hypothetical protein [Chryseobacterium]|uniref:hypothetical protein n=1 Tax=Chryseobacterium TaxID=59732 RepID=UPI000A95B3B9|nr:MULTISPECIES: hypothetical protein [Chryseobacterium]UDQ52647.1 hypothetical protein LJF28_14530 [Chryseobacterium indologenes]
MKNLLILTSLLALPGCTADTQKLKVSPVYTELQRVAKEIPETGKTHTYTTRKEVTERLNPVIIMHSKNDKTLAFRIQGNISSDGHVINQIRKIRSKKGEQNGNTVTLRYYAEIKKIPGKESADVVGYNYIKDEIYKVPDDIKIIKIELYEGHSNNSSDIKPKMIAQQTYNFFAKI